MATGFPHEDLDCYRLAKSIARWVMAAHFPPRCSSLNDQAVRAATSVPLNIAEGAKGGPGGRNHYRSPKATRRERAPQCGAAAGKAASERSPPGGAGPQRAGVSPVAMGSAAELCAVLDLVDLEGGADRQAELRRIGAMLRRLAG